MEFAEIPEIPDEIKNEILKFLEKVAETFPEDKLKKSLPNIKSDLDSIGLVSLLGITTFLMGFLLEQTEKKEQPNIKIQIEIMKHYLRLLDLYGTDLKNEKMRKSAKKHLDYWENLSRVEEFMSRWQEIILSLEKVTANGENSINEKDRFGIKSASAAVHKIKLYDPKNRIN